MRYFIAANWKMNKNIAETADFLEGFKPLVQGKNDVDIVIAPPFTALSTAAKALSGTEIILSAQNVFWEEKGAYTGEVSPLMIKDTGCRYVIVGHSERRQYFSENDEILNRKAKAAQKAGLGVIFCIGESLGERDSGQTFNVLQRELEKGLDGVDPDMLVVAYEPIWAIGTGRTATLEQAQEAHAFIRKTILEIYGNKAANIRIIYGGSVTPENVDTLMACNDVNGALVGGASLKQDSFSRIVHFKKES